MPTRIAGTIIITRPEHSARRAAEYVASRGRGNAAVLISPVLKIVPLGVEFELSGRGGVVLTSENAVRSMGATDIPPGMTAYCVGKRTAAIAASRGFRAVRAGSSSESLVALIRQQHVADGLVYLRGRHVATDIAGMLRHVGQTVEEVVLYDQARTSLAPEARRALETSPCIMPLFSARTARIVAEDAREVRRGDHLVCCISDKVAAAFDLGWECRVAAEPTADSLLSMTLETADCLWP